MVSRATIIAKVNYGLGKGAAVLGYPINVYRATSASNPVNSANLILTTIGDFDTVSALKFTQQAKVGQFQFYFLGDPTGMLVGDYLVGQGADSSSNQTFFVAAIGGVEPASCIRCNGVLTFTRAGGTTEANENTYGGRIASTDVPLMTGWPASILHGGRTTADRSGLPGDVPEAGFQVLMPAYPGVTLRTSDRLTDDLGRAFVVSSAELTPLGWRLFLVLTVT